MCEMRAVIRTAARDDLPSLRALFARANGAPYALEAVTEEKCFGDGIAGAPVTRVYGDFEGAAVTCGKWLRVLVVDRDARRRGIGSALLADSNASVIFAEPGNYFTPGVFKEDEGTRAFFTKRGYIEKAWTWNVHCGAAAALGRRNEHVPRCDVVKFSAAEGGRRSTVLDFIEQHFGKIWRFECSRALGIVTSEENGELTGFAAYEANNRGLGVFGPTGVVKSMRGRGIGRDLLLQALAELHALGYERAIIPWTDALDFYRKSCGAEPAHQFVALTSVP
jgi:GNAT superfamily N-acetyltransferase